MLYAINLRGSLHYFTVCFNNFAVTRSISIFTACELDAVTRSPDTLRWLNIYYNIRPPLVCRFLRN